MDVFTRMIHWIQESINQHKLALNRKMFVGLCAVVCFFFVVWAIENHDLKVVTNKTTKHIDLQIISNKNDNIGHFYVDIDGWCSGVSNMLFRIASLYAIGKQIDRQPCLQGACAEDYTKELYSTFPNLDFPMRTKCWNESAIVVPFADKNPRIYENVTKLQRLKEFPCLRLNSSYLQQVKFFEDYRPQIQEMFKFSSEISKKVDSYAKTLFNTTDLKDTKVCVHMRRTDFVSNTDLPLMPSTLEFTVPAMRYVVELAINETNKDDISVVMFSDDARFVKTVVSNFRTFNNNTPIYIPDNLVRLEYMNLASRYCDYYVLTASGSTYGWWTAFLMPDSRQNHVFYNSWMFRPHRKDSAKPFVESYFFPPKWRRLVLSKKTSEVFEQDRKKVPLVPI